MLSAAAIAFAISSAGIKLPPLPESEVICLAQNVYHEARNQSQLGQIAVTHVVLNRVRSERYPNTACNVIKQAKWYGGRLVKNKCQFSWYCDGKPDINPENPANKEAWEEALQMAMSSYMMYYMGQDVTNGAMYYHANYVNPWWNAHFERVAKIGTHIFYKRKST